MSTHGAPPPSEDRLVRFYTARTMQTGRRDPLRDLPAAYSHRPGDLAGELAAAGLVDVEVLGVEGPGWILFSPDPAQERVEALRDAARLCDGHADMTAAGAHLLAVARRA